VRKEIAVTIGRKLAMARKQPPIPVCPDVITTPINFNWLFLSELPAADDGIIANFLAVFQHDRHPKSVHPSKPTQIA
jgi:hypothetical protein